MQHKEKLFIAKLDNLEKNQYLTKKTQITKTDSGHKYLKSLKAKFLIQKLPTKKI